MREQCTRDPKGRQVEVWPHTVEVQRMRARLQEPGPRSQWQQRREIIERRFGQIKQHDGFRRWTVWGLENVRTQWSVLCATLNLRILWRRWQAGQKAPRPKAAAVWAEGASPGVTAIPGCLEQLRRGRELVSAIWRLWLVPSHPPSHRKNF